VGKQEINDESGYLALYKLINFKNNGVANYFLYILEILVVMISLLNFKIQNKIATDLGLKNSLLRLIWIQL